MLTNSELRQEAEAAREPWAVFALLRYHDAVRDPAVVIRLLDEIDSLTAERDALAEENRRLQEPATSSAT